MQRHAYRWQHSTTHCSVFHSSVESFQAEHSLLPLPAANSHHSCLWKWRLIWRWGGGGGGGGGVRQHQQITNLWLTMQERQSTSKGAQMTSRISQGKGQHEHGQVPTSCSYTKNHFLHRQILHCCCCCSVFVKSA